MNIIVVLIQNEIRIFLIFYYWHYAKYLEWRKKYKEAELIYKKGNFRESFLFSKETNLGFNFNSSVFALYL